MVGLMQSVSTLVPYISESLRSFNGRGGGKSGYRRVESVYLDDLSSLGIWLRVNFSRNDFNIFFVSCIASNVFILNFYCICPSLNKLY